MYKWDSKPIIAATLDDMPAVLYTYMTRLKYKGFTDEQAFTLTIELFRKLEVAAELGVVEEEE